MHTRAPTGATMLTSGGSRRLWVCTRCVGRVAWPRPQWRCKSTAAGTPAPGEPGRWLPADCGVSSRHDDANLRSMFDYPKSSSWPMFSFKSQGLFKNRFLKTPAGFFLYAQNNVDKAARVVQRILAASTTSEYQAIVRDLDRLSDLLCRVLDMCDFVRMTHPDHRFRNAAESAWAMAYQYMNKLNTMTGLNDQLTEAMSRPEVTAAWSEEEKAVADLLKLDFMKSAVNLSSETRDSFVSLSSQVSSVGNSFIQQMEPKKKTLTLPSHRFYGLPPGLATAHRKGSDICIPTTGSDAASVLQTVYDDETRKELYLANRTASSKAIRLLQEMLHYRARQATLSGFESYGHMILKDRMMAKSPASVMKFMLALWEHNAPAVEQELRDLTNKKREMLFMHDVSLQPWDKDFYMQQVRADMGCGLGSDDRLLNFFSIGTVMQGLSRLFDRLYGVRLVPVEAAPGETWHTDVKRLDVMSDDGELVAVLYCDLFHRAEKSTSPAHYTIRCSREILAGEVDEAGEALETVAPPFDSAELAANDGMETSARGGRLMQLPTIALVCDFRKDSFSQGPALLPYQSVETLFHEMGHAIHSVLARTRFQNVSGTRCATDFAELPSTLMEHFAADPSVLALFARHWQTDEPIPLDRVAERAQAAKRFEGMETEHQILLAMVDQAYHASDAIDPGFDTTAVSHGLHRRYAHGPLDPPQTRWQGFFGHLFSYGSTYYSYLFDRVLAERVWRVVFGAGRDGGAVSRENGERLKENLLQWGGGRDPWRCLSDTLREERLAPGDEESMALVGSWGIKDKPRP